MLGNFVGFLISGLAISLHSFTWLLIGRSVAGANGRSLPIAQAAMIDISSDAQKASRLGLVVLANVLGFVVGPVIGGFLMDQNIFRPHLLSNTVLRPVVPWHYWARCYYTIASRKRLWAIDT